jgi:hypothetical protein
MRTQDYDKFYDILELTTATYNRTYTEPEIKLFIRLFEPYPLQEIEQAYMDYFKSANKFAPVPGQILELIPAAQKSKHIGADEAWAIAREAMDINNAVVSTAQIVEAWGIAEPLYSARDEIPARMAFRDAYNRIIKTAPENPKWFFSPGVNKAQTISVISQAVALGRLSEGADKRYLLPDVPINLLIDGYAEKTGAKQKALELIHNNLGEVKKPPKTLAMLTEEDRLLKLEEQKKRKTNMINAAYLRQIEDGTFGKGLKITDSVLLMDENNLPDFLKDVDDSYKRPVAPL